ncbi:hypothetical protein BDA99DRAFT_523269, partial [Phascolomyces articulosus]
MGDDTIKRQSQHNLHDNDDLEKYIVDMLKYNDCLDLKQTMLESLVDITQNNDLLSIKEKATQWLHDWMTHYSDRLSIRLDQALTLCHLATSTHLTIDPKSETLKQYHPYGNDRKLGEDIRVLLPIPSGCFREDVCETMVAYPMPTHVLNSSSWYPPQRMCEDDEDISEEEEDVNQDGADDNNNNGVDNPVNIYSNSNNNINHSLSSNPIQKNKI